MKDLIKLADELDDAGLLSEADVVDGIIKSAQDYGILVEIGETFGSQKFIDNAKASVETMKYLKDISKNLGGEYADIKRDIDAAIRTIIEGNADIVPILNRAKNSIVRNVQQKMQERANMNINNLIKLSDALDESGYVKFANKIDAIIEKIASDPSALLRQKNQLKRKRLYHRRRLDALRRRGGAMYDRYHSQLEYLIIDLADKEDKIDEELQRIADARGVDVDSLIRREQIRNKIRREYFTPRPRRRTRPRRREEYVSQRKPPPKKPGGGASGQPVPSWMQRIINERMGLSGTDIERSGL